MAERTEASEIVLSLEQIPELKEPMPVMELGTKVLAPERHLHDAVRSSTKDGAIKPFGHAGAHAVHDGERLAAFVNPVTGESNVFPRLESPPSGPRPQGGGQPGRIPLGGRQIAVSQGRDADRAACAGHAFGHAP